MSYSEKAETLSMGNGSVSSFADTVSNRVCNKGLFAYTTDMGYRAANIMDGYNISDGGRYHYRGAGTEGGDIAPTIAYYYDKGIIRHAVTVGNQIGESYSMDFRGNGNKFFMSPYEFTLFEGTLRNIQLARIDSDAYNKLKYGGEKFIGEDYSYKASGVQQIYSTIDGEQLGEQYYVPIESITPSQHATLEELGSRFLEAAENRTYIVKEKIGQSLKYLLYKNGYGASNMEYTNSLTDGENDRVFRILKSMDDVAKEMREAQEKYSNRDYESIDDDSLSTDKYSLVQKLSGDEYGTKYLNPERKNFNLKSYFSGSTTDIAQGNGKGLYEYSATWRNKYQARKTYTQQNPYGIASDSSNDNTFERYSINDSGKTIGSAITVSPNFTSGTFITNGKTTRVHDYYQEGGVSTAGQFVSSNDKETARISFMDSGSRLMQKTNKLFSGTTIHSLINRFHSDKITDNNDALISSYSTYGLSRGRNLLRKSGSETTLGYDNPYCRVWTAAHQYSKQKDRIRAFMDDNKFMKLSNLQKNLDDSYRPNNGAERLGANSVLKDNGFLRISSTHDDKGNRNNIKNYMFSIENLAWRDIVERANNSLSKEQIGPNNGRIMWFPPYGLSFTENVSAHWNANKFIGRGEDIYTYVNTQRSGTLSFTLLIDHPSIINQWRGMGELDASEKEEREQDLLRFFAGCGTLSGSLGTVKKEEDSPAVSAETSMEAKPTTETKNVAYVIFFSNDFSAAEYGKTSVDEVIEKLKLYETESSNEPFEERDKAYQNEILRVENYENYNRYGLNINGGEHEDDIRNALFPNDKNIEIRYLIGDSKKNGLIDIAKDITTNVKFGLSGATCSIKGVKIKGFASSHGKSVNNEELCKRRARLMKRILIGKSSAIAEEIVRIDNETSGILSMNENNKDVNSLEAKIARAAIAIISVECDTTSSLEHDNDANGKTVNGIVINNSDADVQEENGEVVGSNVASSTVTIGDDEYAYDNEYKYFAELKEESPLVYKELTEKIRYFDPSFHSVTPEGFNARLTFLHQCTRQGPTYAVSNGDVNQSSDEMIKYAGNLAFGRAPYCILRIGDFFNTKICITSFSVNYDNGGNIAWDLNPEGAGVQPMMAKISMNFNFIGGQDIAGPIERLQNAVTANYYANASIYDRHADVAGSHYFDAWNGTQEAVTSL